MKIMSFGHIPTWAGGRQESGLANVIYQLAKHGSEVEGAEVTLAATDCFVPERMDGMLTILGWTKARLAGYMLAHPVRSAKSFLTLRRQKRKYPISERFVGLYLKRIHFERSVRKVRPNVVHLHGVQAVWYLDLVPRESCVAVTFHGMTGLDANVPQHDILFKMERDVFLSLRVNEVFFICTQLVGTFKEAYGDNGKRNIVIFNSYDNTQFYLEKDVKHPHRSGGEAAGKSGGTTLCTVASLSDLKGQLRVLSGLTLLPDRKKFRYYCIGGGSVEMVKRVNEYARDNGLDFEYLGKMKPADIRRHLYEADYMIMPSSSEGFGLTYLEAIACGVPVILPKDVPIAAEKELINEKNSILLDDCSAESIAKVLGHIDDHHFEAEEVASTVAGFSWDEIARQYVKAFENM